MAEDGFSAISTVTAGWEAAKMVGVGAGGVGGIILAGLFWYFLGLQKVQK